MPPQYIENDIPRIEIEMVVKAMEQSLHTLEETNGHPAQHPSAANSEQLNLAIINYHWVAHQLGQVERPLTRPVWMAEFKADLRAMITESEDRILACFEAYLKDQLTESKDRISALKDQLTKTKKQLGSAIKAVDNATPLRDKPHFKNPPTVPDKLIQDEFQPLFGSYAELDNRDEWEDDIPIAAHAEYFRLQRYAERREEVSRKWAALDNEVVAAYLLNQEKTRNWTHASCDFLVHPARCKCPSTLISQQKVDLIDITIRRAGQLVNFCKCTPDVVRLIHHGYFACSAEQPRTAFSICLVQYHHHLWQASAVSNSAFIKSLLSFLNSRSHSPLHQRGSDHKRRDLRVPFSHCIDLYVRILTNSRKLLEDGLRFTQEDKWANKCPRCFGPSQNEVKQHPSEPNFIIAMDGNFQQRHYAYASKDNPRNEQYPDLFLPPSKIASDIERLSATGIDQWLLEQNYHLNFNHTREKARQELGHLLCLQEELDESWQQPTPTVEQAISRADSCRDIANRIRNQRSAIGPHALIDNLTRPQSDLLWKVWYTKIDVQRRFLALAEEKQPLLQSCRAGEHTTLGTRANQRLIKSVRARANQLRTSLNAYNTRSLAFRTACPTQHAPPTIEYAELLCLLPDDPFWNDGLFTNGNEPWAIDINTQRGIRYLASLKRGNEEERRIGWEVRWALRWATSQHIVIWDILRSISRVSDDAINIPQDLQAFISHDCLGSLSNLNEKISSVIVLMHQRLISIARLQVDWDSHIIEVFENTAQQTGDNSLLELWEQQIKKIVLLMKKTQLSGIPGYVWDETVFTEGTDEIGAENRASATRNTGSRASSINHAEERPQANDPSNSLPQNNDFHADEDDELGEDEYNDNIDHVVQSMEQSMLDNLVA
ncbi:hypothetical protein PtB15_10B341 [Puccinia triticina]|nr:hypothetical protein PtB15_10B341 [Puccinia triticina]